MKIDLKINLNLYDTTYQSDGEETTGRADKRFWLGTGDECCFRSTLRKQPTVSWSLDVNITVSVTFIAKLNAIHSFCEGKWKLKRQKNIVEEAAGSNQQHGLDKGT